ncbi:ADP-ribosylation factor-like protein 1 [Diplonema papillatum]|nr:ADP-ribosylation factor-like protein 1 [Diplonema papillatum]
MGNVWGLVTQWYQGGEETRVLILGLDFAGKTTFLNRLKHGKVVESSPTVGFNLETLQYKSVTFQVWDMGGQTHLRPMWRCYYDDTQAVIWVLDAVDTTRLGVSRQELYMLLAEEELKDAVLLILANKSDLACSMSVADVVGQWDLSSIRDRTWTVRPCSALTGEGINEAMDWLVSAVEQKKMDKR